jgi:hypothetical protein
MSVESDKKKRKVITLDTKLDIIKRFNNGQSKASISRALGLKESAVRLIVYKSNENKEQGKVASTFFGIRCTRNRISCYRKMYEEKKKATSVQMKLDKRFSRKKHIHFSLVL